MTDFMMKLCWPRNVVLWTDAGGGDRMRYELQLQMWGRVKNVSKENVFLHSSKLVVFLLRPVKSGKSGDDEMREKNDRSDAMFRRIDPVPSFFSFSVTSFTSSWLHRRPMVFKFSNFCIVFFIFQRVQSLIGSRRVGWLHVDGCLSKIKLELVVDNPILLRWDIKYVFLSLKTQLTSKLTFFQLQGRFFYSQVEILCRLFLRVKKFEDALLFLLSHRWQDL